MFASRFEVEGLLNKNTGMEYRRYILEPGGSQVSPYFYQYMQHMLYTITYMST